MADILADMEAIELAEISANLNVNPPEPAGVLNGIMAQAIYELWQLAGALYNGIDPDEASGDQLTGLSLITGTDRLAASSTVCKACTVNVNSGFFAAAGSMFAYPNGNANQQFTNETDVNNPGGTPANETVNFVAVNTGPIVANATTLANIAVPLTGWNSITNPTDGVLGTNIEDDADLRLRRELELQASGSTTASAIRSDVLAQMVPPTTTTITTSCTVLYNDTEADDANGLPPHSIEVIARQEGATADDDKALALLILNDKAAGDTTHGNSTKTVTDGQGNSHAIQFTRPDDVDLYIAVTVLTDPLKFPTNGSDLVKAALVTFGNKTFAPGDTVYVKHLQASIFTEPSDFSIGVPGVLDVTVFKVDTLSTPVNTANISVGVRQVAVFDTARVSLVVT